MAISQSDVKYYMPQTINKTSTNGGKRSYTQVNWSSVAGLVPAISVAEATAGGTFYTKYFIKLENSDDAPLYLAQIAMVNAPTGDDQYSICLGTSSDTQSSASGYAAANWACGGALSGLVNAGEKSFSVICELTSYGIQTSRNYMLTDGTHTEVFPIQGVSWVGTTATITIDPSYNSDSGLHHTYSSTNTYCGSLLNVGTVTTSWTEVANPNSVTITGNITTYNAGTIADEYIVTFESATTYKVAKTSAPSTYLVEGASISSNTSIQNPDETTGHYLFTIPSGFFGGTIVTGYTYTFSTAAAEIPVWIKRVVPTSSTSGTMNMQIRLIGESV